MRIKTRRAGSFLAAIGVGLSTTAALPALGVLAAVGAAMSLSTLSGCTYVDPTGKPHTLKPYSPSPNDPPSERWRVLRRFTDPETDEVYELIDTDGDGDVDLIRRVRDDRYIRPQEPFDPFPSGGQQNPQSFGDPIGGTPLPVWLPSVREGFSENDELTEDWEPFDFGNLTAAQWIDSLGLDVAPGTTIQSNNLHLSMVSYIGGPDAYIECVVMWSSAFGMPTLENLDYRITSLDGGPGEVDFIVMRLHGSAQEVIRALAEIGSESFGFTGDQGDEYEIVRNGSVADVYASDSLVATVPLN